MVANKATTDSVFHALGDPTRRRILDGLARGRRRATDIAGDFPVTRQAVAKHLRILEHSGLVRVERRGRERLYHLESSALSRAEDWLTSFRLQWAARLMALKDHVERRRP
jgi:predicted transcriptional regulator